MLLKILIEYDVDLNINHDENYLEQACDFRNNIPKLEIIKILADKMPGQEKVLIENANLIFSKIAEDALYNPNQQQFNDLGLHILMSMSIHEVWSIHLNDEFSSTLIYKFIKLLKTANNFREVMDFVKSFNHESIMTACLIFRDMKTQDKLKFFAPPLFMRRKIANYIQTTAEKIMEEALFRFLPMNNMVPKN